MLRAWEVRDETTDHIVFDEVWNADVYRLVPREGARYEPVDFTRGPVLDIGANVGAFALRAIDLGAPHVVCVEPNPLNVRQLLRNVELCQVVDKVTVLRAAAAPTTGTVLRFVAADAGSHAVASGGDFGASTIAIADLLSANARWSCLKIDIEGGEYDACSTLDVDALNRVDRLVMEFHGPGMGHLAHVNPDAIGPLVSRLMAWGVIETIGRPSVGGSLFGTRYGA